MISAIQSFFKKNIGTTDKESNTHTSRQLYLATATLLIEVARADTNLDRNELDGILSIIKTRFELNEVETAEIFSLAEEQANQLTSYFEFSSLVNKEFSYEEKVKLIELMWKIALIDEKLDRYEDHLIRKIANLIYVKRQDIVKSKHDAINALKR